MSATFVVPARDDLPGGGEFLITVDTYNGELHVGLAHRAEMWHRPGPMVRATDSTLLGDFLHQHGVVILTAWEDE